MSARIICVDAQNDGRGPLAQAYLELLRLWSLNTTSHRSMLFHSVTSAGFRLSTDFTAKHALNFSGPLTPIASSAPRFNTPLHAFDDQKTFPSSEKRQILARVGNRNLRGLRKEDFLGEVDYMICFDREAERMLKVLRGCAIRDSNATNLKAAISDSRIVCLDKSGAWNKSDMSKSVYGIKNELRAWVASALGWRKPSVGFEEGMWRSRQLVVREPGYRALKGKDAAKLEVVKKSGCTFWIEGYRGAEGRVVTVTGPKDKLGEAVRLVEGAW